MGSYQVMNLVIHIKFYKKTIEDVEVQYKGYSVPMADLNNCNFFKMKKMKLNPRIFWMRSQNYFLDTKHTYSKKNTFKILDAKYRNTELNKVMNEQR